MNFFAARDYSADKLWIRREAWPSAKYVICWRGLWFIWNDDKSRVVEATDYNATDLTGLDWTTVPEALATCPIDSTIGSTGGQPPQVNGGGLSVLPSDPNIGFPFLSTGGTSGTGSGSGPSFLPPAQETSTVKVVFDGIELNPDDASAIDIDLHAVNTTHVCQTNGSNSWRKKPFQIGIKDPEGEASKIHWEVNIQRSDGKFKVQFSNELFGGGGFDTEPGTEQARGLPIANWIQSPNTASFRGGFAKVI